MYMLVINFLLNFMPLYGYFFKEIEIEKSLFHQCLQIGPVSLLFSKYVGQKILLSPHTESEKARNFSSQHPHVYAFRV